MPQDSYRARFLLRIIMVNVFLRPAALPLYLFLKVSVFPSPPTYALSMRQVTHSKTDISQPRFDAVRGSFLSVNIGRCEFRKVMCTLGTPWL